MSELRKYEILLSCLSIGATQGQHAGTKLSADAALIDSGSAPDAGKVRVLSLGDLDRRTSAYRSAQRLLGDLLSDLGGEDHASAGQRELAQRAAVLGALIEDSEVKLLRGETVDLNGYLASVNCHRRLLSTLGLERRARPVRSLRDIIREGEPR